MRGGLTPASLCSHAEELDPYPPATAAAPEARNKKLRSGLQDYLKYHGQAGQYGRAWADLSDRCPRPGPTVS